MLAAARVGEQASAVRRLAAIQADGAAAARSLADDVAFTDRGAQAARATSVAAYATGRRIVLTALALSVLLGVGLSL